MLMGLQLGLEKEGFGGPIHQKARRDQTSSVYHDR